MNPGASIEIRRRQRGIWANKSFPYRVIRGTVVGPLAEGRIPVQYRNKSNKLVTERCALATVYAIDGSPTPWAGTLR